MAKVIIPDKICRICGGNEWYNSKRCVHCSGKAGEKYRATHKAEHLNSVVCWQKNNPLKTKIINRLSKKKAAVLLTDAYIRHTIYCTAKYNNVHRDLHEISDHEVEMTRTHIIKLRTLKKARQMENSTTVIPKKEKGNRSKTKRLLKLEELHSYLDPTVTLSISTNVRDNKRWALRKELGVRTIEEVEEAINSLKQELANEFSSKIDSSTTITELAKTALVGDERKTVAKSSDDNDVVAEFKKLEERRQEILQYVEAFNNYVESFKINLS